MHVHKCLKSDEKKLYGKLNNAKMSVRNFNE